MRSLLIFFLHFCCLFNGLTVVYGQITQGECFFPDGATRAPDDVPCYGDGSTPSPCCNKDAFCLDNGLCFGNGALSRGTCTDPWGPECATHCVDDIDCDPSIGCTVITCDSYNHIFSCSYAENCQNHTKRWTMSAGNAFIFREDQVKKLHLGTEALTISPTTSLAANVSNLRNSTNPASTVTVTARAAKNVGQGAFTANQMAGVGAGIAGFFLLALLAAFIIILKQRKTIHGYRLSKEEQSSDSERSRSRPTPEKSGREIIEIDPSAERQEIDGTLRQEMGSRSKPPTPEPYSWQATPESTLIRATSQSQSFSWQPTPESTVRKSSPPVL